MWLCPPDSYFVIHNSLAEVMLDFNDYKYASISSAYRIIAN